MVEINNMTIKWHMIRTHTDHGTGVLRPKIEDDVAFKIKGHIWKELRDTPFGCKDEGDANEHIEEVFEISDMFNLPKVTKNHIMLMVFPKTHIGATKRWIKSKHTWELLKNKLLLLPNLTSWVVILQKLLKEFTQFKLVVTYVDNSSEIYDSFRGLEEEKMAKRAYDRVRTIGALLKAAHGQRFQHGLKLLGASQKTTPSVGKKNVSTSSNGIFSLINSFEALNIDNTVIEEAETEGKCVFVNDAGKPLEKVDYSGDQGSKNEVESVENEKASYLALKPSGVRYGTKSLLKQWRETYVNAD
ncbi:hypothetical protein Tco_0903821 [Tanacetum coccineum]